MFQIIEYREPLHKAVFEKLNREWIERDFELEPHDLAIFESPESYIIGNGGYIFMASKDGEIVGTCSGIKRGNVCFELAKLAVTDKAQGFGIGKALSVAVIEKAQSLGAKEVLITTNTKLETAMKLYEKLGFEESPKSHHDEYKRCNKSLILKLH